MCVLDTPSSQSCDRRSTLAIHAGSPLSDARRTACSRKISAARILSSFTPRLLGICGHLEEIAGTTLQSDADFLDGAQAGVVTGTRGERLQGREGNAGLLRQKLVSELGASSLPVGVHSLSKFDADH